MVSNKNLKKRILKNIDFSPLKTYYFTFLYSTLKIRLPYSSIYFYLLLITAITVTYEHLNAVNSISIILVGFFWLLEGKWKEKYDRLLSNKSIIPYVCFFLLNSIGLIYTTDLGEGFSMLEKFLPILAFPLILGTITPLSKKQVQIITASFVGSCILGTLICLAKSSFLFYTQNTTSFFYNDLLAVQIDIQALYLAIYVGFCIIWLSSVLFKNEFSLFVKIFILFLIVYLLGFEIMLSIRMVIGVLFVYILVVSQVYFYKIKKIRLGIFVFLGVGGLLFTSVYMSTKTKDKFEEAFDVNENIIVGDSIDHSLGRNWGGRALRVAIWKCAWNVIEENPLTGVGTGDVKAELQKSYKKNNFLFAADYNVYNSHNQFLETQLAVGFLGTFSLLFCFAMPFYEAWKNKDYWYLSFLVFIFFNCMTEAFLGRQKGAVFFGLLSSLWLFHYSGKAKTMQENNIKF